MRHVCETDLLQALKQSLHDLDNLKLLSPNQREILDLRRSLKEQIAALERQQSEAIVRERGEKSDYEVAA